MTTSSFKLDDIFSVVGKVVIITGGGTGLGKALTSGFAINGARVYITGRRLEVLQKTADELNASAEITKGGEVKCIQGDVSTKAGVEKIVKQIEEAEQVVDVLINCAGVVAPWKIPIADHDDPDAVEKLLWDGVDDEAFNYSNSININGVYFMTAALVPLLRKSDNPSVVVIASIAGLLNQRTMGSLTYGVSKAGAIHLSELLAGRLSPMKIRVNCICPGIFPSEMTGSNTSEPHSYDLGDGASKAVKRSPMQRAGQPQEIVGPILMLSSKGGMYTNNAVITVDGGRSMGAGIYDGIRLPEDTYN